ncbi:hypothetical protein PWEIH_12300 [Listeria weihenstephanensis FSL R9-0317]|uniref:Uridine kinase n=1 Tax=Listeria weihenstephanensis TaxID=1006155 RepID=A0A1S7FUU0_9LIST|nr:kinase [Listeria weihenstephanensis]AQY51140.1 hypothetical protein UE46_08825 [Listeria weihenstephanensis]EUJ36931.1 hypothetical protein PWEIH_12300 [Listeria weihenstephanensis FSL R9-0317]
MESKLIIIRGNSGSGKTTVARRLQEKLGDGTLLVSQDIVRRDMLRVRDRCGNLSVELIQTIAEYGNGKCAYVIVEGILGKANYQNMLQSLLHSFDNNADVYYFDIPFSETVKRHETRENAHEFGVEKLKEWWLANDSLGIEDEIMLASDLTKDEIVNIMLEKSTNSKA